MSELMEVQSGINLVSRDNLDDEMTLDSVNKTIPEERPTTPILYSDDEENNPCPPRNSTSPSLVRLKQYSSLKSIGSRSSLRSSASRTSLRSHASDTSIKANLRKRDSLKSVGSVKSVHSMESDDIDDLHTPTLTPRASFSADNLSKYGSLSTLTSVLAKTFPTSRMEQTSDPQDIVEVLEFTEGKNEGDADEGENLCDQGSYKPKKIWEEKVYEREDNPVTDEVTKPDNTSDDVAEIDNEINTKADESLQSSGADTTIIAPSPHPQDSNPLELAISQISSASNDASKIATENADVAESSSHGYTQSEDSALATEHPLEDSALATEHPLEDSAQGEAEDGVVADTTVEDDEVPMIVDTASEMPSGEENRVERPGGAEVSNDHEDDENVAAADDDNDDEDDEDSDMECEMIPGTNSYRIVSQPSDVPSILPPSVRMPEPPITPLDVDDPSLPPLNMPWDYSQGPPPIEIVFSFDTTGSMSRCLNQVREQLHDVIRRLFMDIPQLRIAIIAHGDYCDATHYYVTKMLDFTNDVNALCDFVKECDGTGGGDWEECYELVLREVKQKLSWQPGTQRSLVMIGDAAPHAPDYHLNTDNIDWRKEVDQLYQRMGVGIYSVQCLDVGAPSAKTFWEELASRSHGKHLKLESFGDIVDLIMAICYREHGAEHFQAYEQEVRAREGRAIRAELGNVLESLRTDDAPTSSSVAPVATTPVAPVATTSVAPITTTPVGSTRPPTPHRAVKAASSVRKPSSSARVKKVLFPADVTTPVGRRTTKCRNPAISATTTPKNRTVSRNETTRVLPSRTSTRRTSPVSSTSSLSRGKKTTPKKVKAIRRSQRLLAIMGPQTRSRSRFQASVALSFESLNPKSIRRINNK